MLLKNKKIKFNWKYIISTAFFSIIFGMFFSLANQLRRTNCLNIKISETILAGCFLFIALFLIWKVIQKIDNTSLNLKCELNKRKKFTIFIASLCLNLICLITYFPGVGMNDGLNIMYHGMSQAQQFPIFYCIILTSLTKIGQILGSLQYSVIIYSVIQIICVSILYTWIIVWIFQKNIPKYLKYIIAFYFFFEPLLAMYGISMLKDTLFSLLLLIFMMIVYDIVIEKRKIQGWVSYFFFMLVLFGILSLRNNGSYVVFPILFILIIICSVNRKTFIYMFLFAVVITIFQKLLMGYFGSEQLFQEMVGIPLQQIAAVVVKGGNITTDQADFINNLMPIKDIIANYNPATVDSIKWNSAFNRTFLNENKIDFLITWLSMLPHNFLIYVQAYLQQTFWFWAPWQEGTVQCLYSIESVSDNSWLVEFLKTSGIHDQPLLPAQLNSLLRSWYQLGNKFLREGVCFWIMLSTLLMSVLKNRNWRIILVYAPVLLLWLTIMISTPVAESMRYVFVFAYALPIFVGILFVKKDNV